MKKTVKIIAGISAAVILSTSVTAGCMYFAAKKSIVKLPLNFTVTAHTGCDGTADNSIESIVAANNTGAEIAEFDLRFDSSGMGILAHDEGKENPVTLEEAFSTVAFFPDLKVNVDCKTTDNLKEVYRLSEKYGLTDRIFYTGIEEKDVEAVKAQTPQIPYYLNYDVDASKKNDSEYINSLISLVKEKGAVGLNVKFTGCSKKMTEMFREEGLGVSVWTAKELFTMLKCISFAPDNITTKQPEMLIKLIKHLSK
ncbi:MAG: glycerophosphodiester phosphodiesterase [Clostridia bacterium]|nr:glycerophosphodiester phosphodiesterase [Clostridia bacterium]